MYPTLEPARCGCAIRIRIAAPLADQMMEKEALPSSKVGRAVRRGEFAPRLATYTTCRTYSSNLLFYGSRKGWHAHEV